MRLAAYVRVSTDLQAEHGQGLDIQRKAIRAWAKANGHRIVAWYADEGISGSNGVEARQGLHHALLAVENAAATGLVVFKLDRLARRLTVQEAALGTVWAVGGRVFATDLGEVPQDDPDDPIRTALRQMVGVFAQLERGMIAARLRAGRRLKAERGGYAGGAPRFGYRAEARSLVADDAEQAALVRIADRHEAGASTRTIAAELNADGFAAKRGGPWSSATVARVVRRLHPE